MSKNYNELIAGTNIDPRSFLSTDYFNHFNEVVMLFGMLPDMPDMIEEIEKWSFQDYCEHFANSSLKFAPLAIELHPLAPPDLLQAFERLIGQMHMLVLETRASLREALEMGNTEKFADISRLGSMQLQGMIDSGGAIVHGYSGSLDQEKINALF